MVDSNDFRPSSPVPADEFLFEGETPFTDFGQFGEGQLDLRVFEQDVWWVDVHGTPHLLTEMSTEYLNNVLGHLFRNLEFFHLGNGLRYAIENLLAVLPVQEAPDNFQAYQAYIDAKESPLNSVAAVWLNETPLVKRINEILESRDE